MKNKIALYGYFGFDNLGDELILEVFNKNEEFDIFSRKDLKNNFYSRFDILNLIRHKIIVFPGGTIFQNRSSKLSLFYYLFIVLICKCFFKKVYLFNQGFGPVNGFFSFFLSVSILNLCDFFSVRTEIEYNNIIKYFPNLSLGADSVFSNLEELDLERENEGQKRCIILKTLYLRNYPTIPEDFDIIAFSRHDYKILKEKYISREIICVYEYDLKEIINFFYNYSYVITMPLHGAILSYIAGVKNIFIKSYDEKLEYFYYEIKDECNIITEFKWDIESNIKRNSRKKLKEFIKRSKSGIYLK